MKIKKTILHITPTFNSNIRRMERHPSNPSSKLDNIGYKKMTGPFKDSEIIGSESRKFTYQESDFGWLFHPIACLMTLWIYMSEITSAKFKINSRERKVWRQ